jgi:hypothetical protein
MQTKSIGSSMGLWQVEASLGSHQSADDSLGGAGLKKIASPPMFAIDFNDLRL